MSVTQAHGWLADGRRTALAAAAVLTALLASVAARAGVAPAPVLHLESGTTGEIEIIARGVTIAQVLNAVAAKVGIEVLIEEGVARPVVNLTVPMAPAEDVLREILRGRNYALVYDGDAASMSQVILLAPSTAGRPNVVSPRQRRKTARAPVVVRN